MKSPHPFYTSIAIAMTLLTCSVLHLAGQDAAPNAAQSSIAKSYPNTADGLHSLLTELLANAKAGDESKVWSKIAELEIPGYENWFTHAYGQEKGQALAAPYGKSLKVSEQQFEMLWMELAKQEGEISISRPDVANRKFDTAKTDEMFANPTDEFKANWKKTDASAGPSNQAIGYFCFADGKFRLKNFPHEVQIVVQTGAPVPARVGKVVPARLVNKVQPEYPEAARKLRIQGMVALNVIVHKDGTVTVQNVGAGHPLLAPAAVAAVQQWQYQPTTVNGEPFEVLTKVYLTFDLKPQGELKQ